MVVDAKFYSGDLTPRVVAKLAQAKGHFFAKHAVPLYPHNCRVTRSAAEMAEEKMVTMVRVPVLKAPRNKSPREWAAGLWARLDVGRQAGFQIQRLHKTTAEDVLNSAMEVGAAFPHDRKIRFGGKVFKMLPLVEAATAVEARDVTAEVKRIISEQLDVEEDDIYADADLIDDLGADSLGLVEIVLALEETFGIDIPDKDIEVVRTVADAINYVEHRMGMIG